MTSYAKWDKFAKDLASDTESEEERDLSDFAQKTVRYIHVPPRDFSQKAQLCKLLEEEDAFEAPSSAAAGVCVEDGEKPPSEVARALKKYGWSSIGSQFIPGYGASSNSDDLWRVFFDDNFLCTQKEKNPGARALLGHQSLGSFVVSCMERSTGQDRPISRKEVADLIMRRQQGLDAERINLEAEKQTERMALFDQLGAQRVDLKPPEA
mmetsp:Transcript_105752/g.296099  ORF Transcript_105752/g.296099 Transcript_105752/m.296099 type:complete len:209 (-) Transcript_105752:75-701(-)